MVPLLALLLSTIFRECYGNNVTGGVFEVSLKPGTELVEEVMEGRTATLLCPHDGTHNFMFWQLVTNDIVGPSNNYNKSKYNYEVLTGRLFIKEVSPSETGLYNCYSRGVDENDIHIRPVMMIVKPDWEEDWENDSEVNTLRVLIIVAVLLLIILIGVYVIWRKVLQKRDPNELIGETSDDEDESTDEIFTAPGTSNGTKSVVMDQINLLDETKVKETDFGKVFKTISIKENA